MSASCMYSRLSLDKCSRALDDQRSGGVPAAGQFQVAAGVLILARTIDDAVTVPTSAVQHDATQPFVYVIQEAHAHLRHVKTGVVEGDTTQVDGIEPGTVVANSSFEKLQDGAPVVAQSAVASREPAEGSGPR